MRLTPHPLSSRRPRESSRGGGAVRAGDVILAAGAAARLSRLVTTDKLGGWLIVEPAERWALRHEVNAAVDRGAIDAEVEMTDEEWDALTSGLLESPRTWQGRLVAGLSCPFCIGFWITLAALIVTAALPRTGPVRAAWRTLAGALGLNYALAHLSSRLDV